MHVVETRLIDDANDGQQILAVVAERNLRADSLAAREELSREAAIDQRFPHAVATQRLEGPPLNDAHAHHLDVAGADAQDIDERRIALRVTGDAGRAGNRDGVLTRRRDGLRRGAAARAHQAGIRPQRSDWFPRRRAVPMRTGEGSPACQTPHGCRHGDTPLRCGLARHETGPTAGSISLTRRSERLAANFARRQTDCPPRVA